MRRQAGFTLLEVLVALTVLGFIVAGLGQGLRFGLRATERQERLAMERGDLDAVDRLLRRLIAQMDPGTRRTPAAPIGDPTGFTFATDLGAAASALAGGEADVRLEAAGGRLLLRWRPAPHVTPLAAPPPMQDVTVLEGVDRIEIAYWQAAGDAPPGWRDTWRDRALPQLVRIRLVFPDRSARRWPDIVAGPARSAPAQ